MSGNEISDDAAIIFTALGDRTRLGLLHTLSDGELYSITTLACDIQLTRQAVTKHLRMLERAGLVRSLRQGRESRFAIKPEGLDGARVYLDSVMRQWEDALFRLKTFVEHDLDRDL